MQVLFFTGLGGHDWVALHDVSSLACGSPKAPSSTSAQRDGLYLLGESLAQEAPWGGGQVRSASGRTHQAEEEEIKEILGVVSSFSMGCPCLRVWARLAFGVRIGPKGGQGWDDIVEDRAKEIGFNSSDSRSH